MSTPDQIDALVANYIAVWNEADSERRRASIRQLWSEGGAHFTPSMEMRGYGALEDRIATAHQKWVREAGYLFKYSGNVQSHHNGVRFNWAMVTKENNPVSLGFDFLILDDEGRIVSDHQFLDPMPT